MKSQGSNPLFFKVTVHAKDMQRSHQMSKQPQDMRKTIENMKRARKNTVRPEVCARCCTVEGYPNRKQPNRAWRGFFFVDRSLAGLRPADGLSRVCREFVASLSRRYTRRMWSQQEIVKYTRRMWSLQAEKRASLRPWGALFSWGEASPQTGRQNFDNLHRFILRKYEQRPKNTYAFLSVFPAKRGNAALFFIFRKWDKLPQYGLACRRWWVSAKTPGARNLTPRQTMAVLNFVENDPKSRRKRAWSAHVRSQMM